MNGEKISKDRNALTTLALGIDLPLEGDTGAAVPV